MEWSAAVSAEQVAARECHKRLEMSATLASWWPCASTCGWCVAHSRAPQPRAEQRAWNGRRTRHVAARPILIQRRATDLTAVPPPCPHRKPNCQEFGEA